MAEFNPYQSPALPVSAPPEMSLRKILFSFKGRIPRKTYWCFTIPVNAAIALLLERLFTLGGEPSAPSRSALPSSLEATSSGPPWQAYVLIASYLPLLWIKLAVLAKRWHDQNRSANWLILTFIPIVGMVINFLECGCNPGTRGENRYGPDPIPDPQQRPPSPPVAGNTAPQAIKVHREMSARNRPPR